MKEKISVSIDEAVVGNIDSVARATEGSSRSHVIESILKDYFLKTSKVKAIVLAGKSDLKKISTSFLAILKNLEKLDPLQVSVAGSKNNPKLFSLIQDRNILKGKISFIEEEELLGTAGIIKKISENNKTEANSVFLVVYADVIFDLDLKKLIMFHKKSNSIATMAVTYVDELKDSTDSISIEGNKITKFDYAPKKVSRLTNACVFVFEPSVIDQFPDKGSLEKEVLPRLAEKGMLLSYVFNSGWIHKG